MKKVLNLAKILPLAGLPRENDIVLRVQEYLSKTYGYTFRLGKFLPWAPWPLYLAKKKWATYRRYSSDGWCDVEGHLADVFSWILPKTSAFWINYLILPLNILFYRLFIERRLLARARAADLIVAQTGIPDGVVAYLLARRTGKPYILVLRGDFQPVALKAPFLNRVYGTAAKVITHSPTLARRLQGVIDAEFVPHPVGDQFYCAQPLRVGGSLRFVSVCRLLPLKNLAWVLKALSTLARCGCRFEYEIVGAGPELERLKAMVEDPCLRDKVVFAGERDVNYVANALSRSHIFVMPSFPETLGRAFLEAAAAGCLIVGHKGSGVDGLFEHGASGVFVTHFTLEYELRRIFDGWDRGEFRELVAASRAIADRMRWARVGELYHNIYELSK